MESQREFLEHPRGAGQLHAQHATGQGPQQGAMGHARLQAAAPGKRLIDVNRAAVAGEFGEALDQSGGQNERLARGAAFKLLRARTRARIICLPGEHSIRSS